MTINVIVTVSDNERTLDSYFQDWYGDVFGYGYGSGEEHILSAVKQFMELVNDRGKYDYKYMEEILGGPITWLLIDIFCKEQIINYGTSPRVGWIEPNGMAVRKYMKSKPIGYLVQIVTDSGPNGDGMNQYHCCTTYCNCAEEDEERKKGCTKNPFFQLFYKGKGDAYDYFDNRSSQ